MRKVIKKNGKIVKAYCLGESSVVERELIKEGKIVQNGSGGYELFSQEAVNGTGEKAVKGDYFKIDSKGFPYPNDKEFFEKNHVHIQGDAYEQIPKPVLAWTKDDENSSEIDFLIREKGLVIDKDNPVKYFNAPLWGSMLSAEADAIIVFYSIDRDEEGRIVDVDFNFVAKDEFDKLYSVM